MTTLIDQHPTSTTTPDPIGPADASEESGQNETVSWTRSFDGSENFCASPLELAAEALPAPLHHYLRETSKLGTTEDPDIAGPGTDLAREVTAEILETFTAAEDDRPEDNADVDEVVAWTARHADLIALAALMPEDAATDGFDEVIADLEEAKRMLGPCENSCTCTGDAYQGWARDWLTESLHEAGDHLWAIHDGARAHTDHHDLLNLDVLFAATKMTDYGFDSVELAFDGTDVTAVFSGYPWGSCTITATRCDEQTAALAETWSQLDYVEDPACDLVIDPRIKVSVALAVDVWAKLSELQDEVTSAVLEPETVFGTFEDLRLAAETHPAQVAAFRDDPDRLIELAGIADRMAANGTPVRVADLFGLVLSLGDCTPDPALLQDEALAQTR